MSSETPKGRPVDEAKRAAVLAAARRHFFGHGYEATRVEDIAAEAGVSKVTIYNRFGDKAALLSACVSRECERMQDEMGLDADDGRTLAERLNAFGATLLTFLFSADHVGFERIISVEGVRTPELARTFFDAGPARMKVLLRDLLNDGAADGRIAFDDVDVAAGHLMGMWKGMADMHLRFAQPFDARPGAVARQVRRATDRFLRAYAP